MKFLRKDTKGFTLIEVLVVVAIIVILLGVIMASMSQARESTRDKKRVADLSNIAFALSIYKEKNREYPYYPEGKEIGVGDAEADDILREYYGNVYKDPLSDGPDSEYGYWYYSDFECNGGTYNVVVVKKMELAKNGNFEEVCGVGAQLPFNILEKITPVAYASGGGTPTASECAKERKRFAAGRSKYTLAQINSKCPLPYSQATYYSQSTYYTQSTYPPAYSQSTYYTQSAYYTQSTYYTQGVYYPWGSDLEGVYIILLKE